MHFIIRCDASHQIGTGHVMRCLTLARKLRESGAMCRFVCREHTGHLCGLIRDCGFEVVSLPEGTGQERLSQNTTAHGHWLGANWQTDAEQTIAAIGGQRPDWMVVDHYALDHRWEELLRPHCGRIMVIDDLADRRHDCDLLLDQNLVLNRDIRYDHLLPQEATRLLGATYALLQPQYTQLYMRTPPRLGPVERILVYFGGADLPNLTGLALTALSDLAYSRFLADVVISDHGVHSALIRTQAASLPWVTLHSGLPTLAPLIARADLAIGAAGATSWERCCLGLPAVIITLADNQIPLARALEAANAAYWAGTHLSVNKMSLKTQIEKVLSDSENLNAKSVSCRQLVQGGGLQSVSDILLLCEETDLIIRPASVNDEELLLRWANDPLVRENSFNSSLIAAEEHKRWFYRRLRNFEVQKIFICETVTGLPIGQVRLELDQTEWVIDYSVVGYARGRRLAGGMLRAALRELKNQVGCVVVVAKVKPANVSSVKTLIRLGFEVSGQNASEMCFKHSL